MSDRLKQEDEIEDVLSSIRRLVAQSSADQDGDALVLTAAQRVEPFVEEGTAETVEGDFSALRKVEIHREPDVEQEPADNAVGSADETSDPSDGPKLEEETVEAEPVETELREDEHEDHLALETTELDSVGFSSLDKYELRELVVEIVREELRGPLGQKITRNVRKLVRQEIHRALNTRSMD